MTFDVFPRRNLPDGAEPWGRAHDDRVLGLEREVQSLGQSLSGQNRNTASSLAVIADQVRTLEGYNPLVATSLLENSTGPVPVPYPSGFYIATFNSNFDPEIEIELAQPGRLLVTLSAFIGVFGVGDAAHIELNGGLIPQVNNVAIPDDLALSSLVFRSGLSITGTQRGPSASLQVQSSLSSSRTTVLEVPAGTVNIKARRFLRFNWDGAVMYSANTFTAGRTLTVQQLPPLAGPE